MFDALQALTRSFAFRLALFVIGVVLLISSAITACVFLLAGILA